jgi:FkbM family methyltransferase
MRRVKFFMRRSIPLRHRLYSRFAHYGNYRGKLRILRWVKQLLRLRTVLAETNRLLKKSFSTEKTCKKPNEIEGRFPKTCLFQQPAKAGMMLLDPSDFVQSQILINGCFEPKTLGLITSVLREGDCFVDVGANVGQFSLAAARCVGASGRVIAIEPSPSICAELLVNRRLNGFEDKIEVIAAALAEDDGCIRFEVPPPDNRGMSAELEPKNKGLVETFIVPGLQLAKLLQSIEVDKIKIVKIDVEGAELRVLRGMLQSGTRFHPENIIFEFVPWLFKYGSSPGELLQFIEQNGYKMFSIDGKPFKMGDPIPEDNLWAKHLCL